MLLYLLPLSHKVDASVQNQNSRCLSFFIKWETNLQISYLMKVCSLNFNVTCSFYDVLPFFQITNVTLKFKFENLPFSFTPLVRFCDIIINLTNKSMVRNQIIRVSSTLHIFYYLTVISQNRSQYKITIDRSYCANFAL